MTHQSAKIGLRRQTATGNRHRPPAHARFEVITDNKVLGRGATHQREIGLYNLMSAELAGQRKIGLIRQGKEKEAGGIGIETMEKDRSRRLPAACKKFTDLIQGIRAPTDRRMCR